MRRDKDALCYAVLGSRRLNAEQHWRAVDRDARTLTDPAFDEHVAALCRVADDVHKVFHQAFGLIHRVACQVSESKAERKVEQSARRLRRGRHRSSMVAAA